MPMRVSLNGLEFIACREALVTVAYHDGKHPDGTPKWSIGFGSQTPPPKEGDTITVADAFERLKADVRSREPAVNKALTREISQHAFDALFSLYYQAGSAAMQAVADKFNSGPEIWAILEFAAWNFG